MVDQKITQLTAATSGLSTDIIPIVVDPLSSATTKKITKANFLSDYQMSGAYQPSGLYQSSGLYQASGVYQSSGNYLLSGVSLNASTLLGSNATQFQQSGLYQTSGVYQSSGNYLLSGVTLYASYVNGSTASQFQASGIYVVSGTGNYMISGTSLGLQSSGNYLLSGVSLNASTLNGSSASKFQESGNYALSGTAGTTDHSALSNLTYATAGHTGFQPSGVYLITISNGDISTLSGTLAITHGGTGQINSGSALNALLPAQAGSTGKYLRTDGTNANWETTTAGVTDHSLLTNLAYATAAHTGFQPSGAYQTSGIYVVSGTGNYMISGTALGLQTSGNYLLSGVSLAAATLNGSTATQFQQSGLYQTSGIYVISGTGNYMISGTALGLQASGLYLLSGISLNAATLNGSTAIQFASSGLYLISGIAINGSTLNGSNAVQFQPSGLYQSSGLYQPSGTYANLTGATFTGSVSSSDFRTTGKFYLNGSNSYLWYNPGTNSVEIYTSGTLMVSWG